MGMPEVELRNALHFGKIKKKNTTENKKKCGAVIQRAAWERHRYCEAVKKYGCQPPPLIGCKISRKSFLAMCQEVEKILIPNF